MTKKSVLILLSVLALITALASPAYCDDPMKKLGRGICNLGTFFFEVPLQISRVNQTDGPMAASTWGILKGFGMSGVRLLTGVYEAMTFPFPLPKDYEPILKDPEFMFEEQNW